MLAGIKNVRFGYINHFDAALIQVTNPAGSLTEVNLKSPHIAEVCRMTGASGAITIDMQATRSFDAVVVIGVSLGATATVRVRASITDATAVAGEVYDSTVLSGRIDARYGYAVVLLPSPVSARYIRIDLAQSGAVQIDVGRVFVGPTWTPAMNFAWGASIGYQDDSQSRRSRGGQLFVQGVKPARSLQFQVEALTEAEMRDQASEMDRLNGLRRDILVCADPGAANLGSVTIWGTMAQVNPFVIPYRDAYTKQYAVLERL